MTLKTAWEKVKWWWKELKLKCQKVHTGIVTGLISFPTYLILSLIGVILYQRAYPVNSNIIAFGLPFAMALMYVAAVIAATLSTPNILSSLAIFVMLIIVPLIFLCLSGVVLETLLRRMKLKRWRLIALLLILLWLEITLLILVGVIVMGPISF